MPTRLLMLLLLFHGYTASSELFEQQEPDIGGMPYQMKGKWHNIGNTKQKRDSGAVELLYDNMYVGPFGLYRLYIYDEDVSYYDARQSRVDYFWKTFLGYTESVPNKVIFQGVGVFVGREKRVSIIDRHAERLDAFKLLKPPGMQFEEFENKSDYIWTDSYWSVYNRERQGGRISQCSFVLRLDVEELPGGNEDNTRRGFMFRRFGGSGPPLKAEGKLVSRKCNTELSVMMDSEYKYPNTNTFGIVVTLLYIAQLIALAGQFMYGWRSHKTFAVSMPSVTLLLFLTIHFVSAISTVIRTTDVKKFPLIVAAVSMGLCCAAYVVWLAMIWMERRQTITKEWMAECVIMLAVATVTYFISYLIMRFIPGGLYLVVFTLYGFFVPQIMSSRKSVHGAIAVHPMFAITTVLVNSAIPMYFWLKSPNFMNVQYNPVLAAGLACYLGTQAAFLVMQFEQRREQINDEYSSLTE